MNSLLNQPSFDSRFRVLLSAAALALALFSGACTRDTSLGAVGGKADTGAPMDDSGPPPPDAQLGEAIIFAGGPQGASCQRESDCASGLVCGYKMADGCSAQGVCVPRWPLPGQAACGALLETCGCNGTMVIAGCNYYDGYAPAPVDSTLGCQFDAGTDGSASCGTWGESCGTCCAGLGCSPSGYPSGLPGSCVPL